MTLLDCNQLLVCVDETDGEHNGAEGCQSQARREEAEPEADSRHQGVYNVDRQVQLANEEAHRGGRRLRDARCGDYLEPAQSQ